MKQLRVLLVIPGNAQGTGMIFSKRQAAWLEEIGLGCKRFFLRSRTSISSLYKELLRLRNEICVFKPHVVHADFGTMTAFFAALATNLPLVITFRGSDLNPSVPGIRSWAGRCLSQVAALRAESIICVSAPLRRRLWWKRVGVSIIPSGVDTSIFYPHDRDEVRSQLGWEREEKVVIFNAGNTPRIKRLDQAELAIDLARKICGEIRFLVLDGSVDPQVMPKLLNAADCLLLTSDWEGSPTMIQEALACNLPIVSVDVGDARERLANVRPSYIVERDPNQIGRTLARILMKPQRSNGSEMIGELALGRLALRISGIYRRAILKE